MYATSLLPKISKISHHWKEFINYKHILEKQLLLRARCSNLEYIILINDTYLTLNLYLYFHTECIKVIHKIIFYWDKLFCVTFCHVRASYETVFHLKERCKMSSSLHLKSIHIFIPSNVGYLRQAFMFRHAFVVTACQRKRKT